MEKQEVRKKREGQRERGGEQERSPVCELHFKPETYYTVETTTCA